MRVADRLSVSFVVVTFSSTWPGLRLLGTLPCRISLVGSKVNHGASLKSTDNCALISEPIAPAKEYTNVDPIVAFTGLSWLGRREPDALPEVTKQIVVLAWSPYLSVAKMVKFRGDTSAGGMPERTRVCLSSDIQDGGLASIWPRSADCTGP